MAGGPEDAIERASSVDLMQLASDVGPVPTQVGAILGFAPGSHLTLDLVEKAFEERTGAIPRLRQTLVRTPLGCGRPVWVDDPGFAVSRHVVGVACAAPGDAESLLECAARIVTDPLPRDRPLWSASLVTGLSGDRCALVVVFHHVLADGIGGLAVLASLIDGSASTDAEPFPRRQPSRRRLARDAAASRLRSLARLPASLAGLGAAFTELRPGQTPRAPRCSLNRPVGTRRRFAVARVELSIARSAAHACGGTVNDVLLACASGALEQLLAHRGEQVDRLVVSVPVSGREATTAAQLGNQVGMMPIAVRCATPLQERIRSTAEATTRQKTAIRGASSLLLAPVFRSLAASHLLGWLMEHQRRVTAFVTNLRGPGSAVNFLGQVVSEIIPLSDVAGNVTTAFAALSYAGTLSITVATDIDAVPDSDVLVAALQRELGSLKEIAP